MFHNDAGAYNLYKADTGALRFKVRYPMGVGNATFALTSKTDPKNDLYQILCGLNVKWVRTKHNFIPENAFVAGFSEVHHEPLYVGRAIHDNQLITGKVHALYSTCYLPYKGKEIEVQEYEILVTADVSPRGISSFVPIENSAARYAIRHYAF